MLQLGERVRVLAVSWKTHTPKGYTLWERGTEFLTPLEGMIVGYRVMAEGHTHYWEDEGSHFHRERSVKTYLVATSIHRMVTARIEDVESLAGEGER